MVTQSRAWNVGWAVEGEFLRHLAIDRVGRIAWISAALAVAGCTVPDIDSFRVPDVSIFRPAAHTALRETALPPITAEDLVDASGRCGAFASAEGNADAAATPANVPTIPGAIAIEMSECEVVRRAGPPEKVDIGTNERGERTATLTYIRGSRPGIYQFTSGRLTVMERAPEPPAPAKPVRGKPKPKRTT
jgi:hypothetical protein